jgi:hypothetical protein
MDFYLTYCDLFLIYTSRLTSQFNRIKTYLKSLRHRIVTVLTQGCGMAEDSLERKR